MCGGMAELVDVVRAEAEPLEAAGDSRPAWRVLLAAAALHTCNDAFFYVLFPLLPFIAAELGLSYTEVGLVNAAFAGSSGLFQLPAGLLGQRAGEYALLVWGNGWVAVGLGAMAAAASFPLLLGMAVLAGLGGNLQHPLAASLVARAYAGRRRGLAIGTLNFAGDLGKLAAPGLVTVVAPGFGWRATLVGLGVFGVFFSAAIGLARKWVRPPSAPTVDSATPTGARRPRAFDLPRSYALLTAVGMLDATTRTAALTFLPFILAARGMGVGEIGLMFGVIFAGGALGKLACGPLGDRFGGFGVVLATETMTALALCGLVWGPLGASLAVAVVLGFGLNGTSSVLYAAVAAFVPQHNHGVGYGLYYTATQCAAALSALGYGVLADHLGLDWTFAAMAGLTFAVVPLAAPIRRRLAVT
jgi:FSR family fosmidomycin resistance protein-like MFS transporter